MLALFPRGNAVVFLVGVEERHAAMYRGVYSFTAGQQAKLATLQTPVGS